MPPADAQFQALLRSRLNQEEIESLPRLTDELARTLIERIDRAPLFAHAYALLGNLTYGGYGPDDVLDFAHRHGLAGACIHLLDGEERSLGRMSENRLREFADRARHLGLEHPPRNQHHPARGRGRGSPDRGGPRRPAHPRLLALRGHALGR